MPTETSYLLFRALRAVAVAGALLTPVAGRALESPAFTDARGTATLISEADSVAAGQPVRVALRLRLAPGWHTYWQNPGDAGIPPAVDWTLPKGASAGPFAWPAPARMTEGPLVTFGYSGDLVLPARIEGLSGPATVVAHATWLACKTVCVPEEVTLTLDLPAGDGAPGAAAVMFKAADAAMPRPAPWATTIAPDGTLVLRGPELGPDRVRAALFAADEPDRVAVGGTQAMTLGPGELRLALHRAAAPNFRRPLAGVLLLTDAGGQTGAYAITAQPGVLPRPAPTPTDAAPELGTALLLAFAGGLILNLMPCVFPILAMKAAALAGLHREGRGRVLAGSVAYALGVLLSFLAVGAGLVALRAAGMSAGWGFQFAHPVFVAGTALLLFLVGMNLSGAFTLDGVSFLGAGQSLATRGGLLGSFFTGALAVLVATPCTAPFMGAALAVAMTAPIGQALAIFAALGLGLAAPYVLLAVVPGFSRALPRPGRWMETLRQALAFPMYASALWLLWVIGRLAGADAVVLTAGAAIVLAFAVWLLRQVRGRIAVSAVLISVAVALWAGETSLRKMSEGATSAGIAPFAGAEAFSPERLAALRQAGRPVLVDMTAAWCVTCLVNERVALDRAAVRDELARRDVALLRGDWTRQDPEITAFLRAQGRDGVPLYLLYPGGDRPPVRLPQILTEGTVLDALRETAG